MPRVSSADVDDPEQYLSPSFDPSDFTVNQLRGVLVRHDVAYPSSAPKGQLIELFNGEIATRAPSILRQLSRTKRTTRGITDVPSSQSSTEVDTESRDTDHDDVNAEPKTPRASARQQSAVPSTRRATRSRTVDRGSIDAPVMESRNRLGRETSKHPRASDVEVDDQPARRRTRRSVAIPSVKTSEADARSESSPLRVEEESPFTQDNPFQSGGSPVHSRHDFGSVHRRKTLISTENKDKLKSGAVGRKASSKFPVQFQQDSRIKVPSSPTFDPAVVPLEGNPGPIKGLFSGETVEAGEEFTAEEQLELMRERAKNGEHDILPPRRPRDVDQASSRVKSASIVILLSLLIGFAVVWRQEKLEIGYCGVGRPATHLGGVQIPEWASTVLPQCEPCPAHAYCSDYLETLCERDFVLKPHPLSLWGLLPFTPSCERDSEKATRIQSAADRVVSELRHRRANYECGERGSDGKVVKSPEIAEAELKGKMSSRRRKGISDAAFDELWKGAFGELLGRDEVIAVTNPITGDRKVSSTSLARLPLFCAVRRHFRVALARHVGKLLTIVTVIAGATYLRWAMTRSREAHTSARRLARYTLDRLAQQASLHAHNPDAVPDPCVPMHLLRDDVLRHEFSPHARSRVWDRVRTLVEANANVRSAVREDRNGDVARVWEWVGAVSHVEEGASPPTTQLQRIIAPEGRGSAARLDDFQNSSAADTPQGVVGLGTPQTFASSSLSRITAGFLPKKHDRKGDFSRSDVGRPLW